jgi:hypothetical protein
MYYMILERTVKELNLGSVKNITPDTWLGERRRTRSENQATKPGDQLPNSKLWNWIALSKTARSHAPPPILILADVVFFITAHTGPALPSPSILPGALWHTE